MSDIWIIGRKITLQTNGHSYLGEPFIAFATEAAADAACDLVERISGDRPMKVAAAFMSVVEARSVKVVHTEASP